MSGSAEVLVIGQPGLFEGDICTIKAGTVHATGRWGFRWGPANQRVRYGERCSRTWPVHRVEIRWSETRAAA